jgi:hypothetical protein
MSRAPSKEGVSEVAEILKRMNELSPKIAEGRKALQQLKLDENEFEELARKIPEKLHEMDVAASGNFGWEGRTTWFLQELVNQLSTKNANDNSR